MSDCRAQRGVAVIEAAPLKDRQMLEMSKKFEERVRKLEEQNAKAEEAMAKAEEAKAEAEVAKAKVEEENRQLRAVVRGRTG